MQKGNMGNKTLQLDIILKELNIASVIYLSAESQVGTGRKYPLLRGVACCSVLIVTASASFPVTSKMFALTYQGKRILSSKMWLMLSVC